MNWISVKDKLPDLHDEVWDDEGEIVHYKASDPVLCLYNTDECVVALYEVDSEVDFGGWVATHDGSNLNSVTHWMELPQPPKEE